MIDTFSSYSEGEESYDEWKEDQSPEGTVSSNEGLRASRDNPSKEGER